MTDPEVPDRWQRLRQRKLFQWCLAYLTGSWLLLQLYDVIGEYFGWPAAGFRVTTVLLAVGLLAVAVLAWYHGDRGQQRVTATEVLILVGIAALAAVGVSLVGDPESAATLAAGEQGAAVAAPVDEQSLAVLPFTDMSPAGDQEYFADGITEEILNAVAQIEGLRVPARTSSFAFKGAKLPIEQIARELRVAHVLEGSVRKADDDLRIAAQLIDARTDRRLWSATFDRELKDVFAIQEEIARAIGEALELRLRGSAAAAGVPATSDMRAYELYLLGRHFWNRRTGPALRRAIEHFEEAVARDTAFADGWAGLALASVVYPDYTEEATEPWLARAERAAHRALRLRPDHADAHTALAAVHWRRWEWRRGEAAFRRALEPQPVNATARQWYAWLLAGRGRQEEALAQLRRARDDDPLSFIVNANLADHLFMSGRGAEAIAQYRTALELQPAHVVFRAALAEVLAAEGRTDEALALADSVLEPARHDDDQRALAMLAMAYARAGHTERARSLAAEVERRAAGGEETRLDRAIAATAAGRIERALDILEEGIRAGESSVGIDVAAAARSLQALRDQPQFVRMQRELRRE